MNHLSRHHFKHHLGRSRNPFSGNKKNPPDPTVYGSSGHYLRALQRRNRRLTWGRGMRELTSGAKDVYRRRKRRLERALSRETIREELHVLRHDDEAEAWELYLLEKDMYPSYFDDLDEDELDEQLHGSYYDDTDDYNDRYDYDDYYENEVYRESRMLLSDQALDWERQQIQNALEEMESKASNGENVSAREIAQLRRKVERLL